MHALGVGVIESHASVHPLELGQWIPKHQCGPWMDSHSLVWILELG